MADVRVVRLNVAARQGAQIAQRYGIRGVPTLIVFDGAGSAALTQIGRLNKESAVSAIASVRP